MCIPSAQITDRWKLHKFLFVHLSSQSPRFCNVVSILEVMLCHMHIMKEIYLKDNAKPISVGRWMILFCHLCFSVISIF